MHRLLLLVTLLVAAWAGHVAGWGVCPEYESIMQPSMNGFDVKKYQGASLGRCGSVGSDCPPKSIRDNPPV